MEIINNIINYSKEEPVIFWTCIVIALILFWYFFLRGGNKENSHGFDLNLFNATGGKVVKEK